MARILTIDPDQTKGLRKLMVRMLRHQNGGIVSLTGGSYGGRASPNQR
jgi:hypothetical protein